MQSKGDDALLLEDKEWILDLMFLMAVLNDNGSVSAALGAAVKSHEQS